jgi:hypothetical protein
MAVSQRPNPPRDLVVRDRDGKIIQRSANLAGIRRYVSGFNPRVIIRTLDVSEIGAPGPGAGGMLSILFEDGANYQCSFASFAVLCDWVKRWRNVRGAPLTINGAAAGKVSSVNPQPTR